MKKEIIIYIGREDAGSLKEFNFHPAFIYTITLAEQAGYTPQVYTSDPVAAELLRQYEFGFTSVSSEKDITFPDGAIRLNAAYPLVQPQTLDRIFKGLENKIYSKLPFISYADKVVAQETTLPGLSPIELLTSAEEKDAVLIDAYIRSDFYKIRPVRKTSGYIIERKGAPGKPRLLFSAPYAFFPTELRKQIESDFDVVYAFNAPYDETKKLVADREIWITGTCPPYKVDEEIINAGKSLRLMATPSTGTNHIDVAHAERKNIRLISIKSSPVIEQIHASSEFSFSLMLAVIKKVPFSTRAAKYGTWREQESVFRNIEVNGKTLGLIGYGRIGKKMARFAESFGMKILAFDPYKKIEEQYVTQVSSREELLQKSDIVSLHYHLTPETVNSFTKKDFDRMKEGAYFINTARGELVNENDFIEALRSGRLKAAGVDVITDEHILEKWDHPLIKYAREHDNLLVSPHIAGCTVDSESKAMNDLLRQIREAGS